MISRGGRFVRFPWRCLTSIAGLGLFTQYDNNNNNIISCETANITPDPPTTLHVHIPSKHDWPRTSSLSEASTLLCQQQACLLENILPEEEREYWLTRLNSGRGTEVTPGRFHLVLKDNDITERDEKQLALFTKRFQSVLAEFFGQDRPYYLTELQLLDSKPGSQNQFYHLDNTSSGVTVLVVTLITQTLILDVYFIL